MAPFVVALLAITLYALGSPDTNWSSEVILIFMFQTFAWASAGAALIYLSPQKSLRISNPAVLFLFWSFLYLIYPSAVWIRGEPLPSAVPITSDTATWLMVSHGLFVLAFVLSYSLTRPDHDYSCPQDLLANLPSGWFLLAIGVCGINAMRIMATGQLLPISYGDFWENIYSNVQDSRFAGGSSYLFTQITSKFSPFPVLITGIGVGLILARIGPAALRQARVLLALSVLLMGLSYLNGGSRSGAFIPLIVGLVLYDILVGVRIRVLSVLLILGVLWFEVFGILRDFLHTSLSEALQGLENRYASEDVAFGGEFLLMFVKESLSLENFLGVQEGISFLLNSVATIVPSQLMPSKMSYEGTVEFLSRQMMGDEVERGRAVAGTSVGDGIRFAGMAGIAMLAAIMGSAAGLIHRWLTATKRAGSAPPLIGVALYAGFVAYSVDFIRTGLTFVMSHTFYYILLPLIAFRLLGGELSLWGRLSPTPSTIVVAKHLSAVEPR